MSVKIITIFSNKGGVGKTFIAVNLSTVFALEGKKVLLIDLDFQAGQEIARMFNIAPRMAIVDVVDQIEVSDKPEIVMENTSRHSCGLHFIPAVRNTKQLAKIDRDKITVFLERAAQYYDYIIIDGGKTFSDTLISAFDMSNLILLIATPDVLAVYQVKWCIDVLQKLQFPLKMVKLILNRSESRGSVAWQEVRSVLPCEIFGHIPSDGKTVGMALNRGIPCVIDSPRSRVSDAFNKIANMLRQESVYVPVTDVKKLRDTEGLVRPGGFWEKFGVSQHVQMGEVAFSVQEDDIIVLKRKIHEKLIKRLNLDGITVDVLSDPNTLQRVRKTAEEVVGNLLMEESAGRAMSREERVYLVKDIVNESLGLGPLEDFLADPEITDIMVNNKDEIYVEKKGKLILTNKRFVSDAKVRAIIDRIIAPLGRRIDESTPMVDARLPDGSRINAIIPPLSLGGPMITIRKFGQERLKIDDLLYKYHSLTPEMADFLRACVWGRKNIIISGGTGSGKTTLLNVISEFIPDGERIITIEDAAELKLKKSHWARLESRPPNVEGKGEVTIRDLFINSLRMRPDRIVIGECRGPEVLDMLQAMNTGHDGSMTTLHANSTRDALIRMHSMILLSGIELPVRAINEMISSAIHIIVHASRYSDGSRKITGITETIGLSEDFYVEMADIFIFKQTALDKDGKVLGHFEPTGYVPKCYDEFITRGIHLDKSIFEKKS